jgi:dolichol-phosphate mannosyltransferase
MKRALTVIPTYNEKENIEAIVRAVLGVRPQHVAAGLEILIVDDGSPDGTGQIADRMAAENPRVHVLHRQGKLGLGTAYVAGFKWGLERGYDWIGQMDADFSHDPKYLAHQYDLLSEVDGAIGSRYVAGGGTVNWGLGRKVLSRGGSFYARLILGAPIRDFTGGFNAWRRAVLERVELGSLRSDGYSFQIELKYRAFLCGFQLREFPIVFEDRKVGHSKMSRRIVFEALQRVWQFRLQRFQPGRLTVNSPSS